MPAAGWLRWVLDDSHRVLYAGHGSRADDLFYAREQLLNSRLPQQGPGPALIRRAHAAEHLHSA